MSSMFLIGKKFRVSIVWKVVEDLFGEKVIEYHIFFKKAIEYVFVWMLPSMFLTDLLMSSMFSYGCCRVSN